MSNISKVGLLSVGDWANFQWGLTKSLQAIGIETVSYKLEPHPFGYEEQLPIITVDKIREAYKDCDVILMVHSDWELMEHLPCDKRVINVATGTKYRQNYEQINTKFRENLTIIALPEFQTLAPNPKYLVGAVGIESFFKPIGERVVIGHFPSNPSVKGTNDIIHVVREAQRVADFDFIHSDEKVSHQENLYRMFGCDIYIELMAAEQGGKPYGSFGISAIEAAALGKLVLTQSINDNGLYAKTYGQGFWWGFETAEQLKQNIISFVNAKHLIKKTQRNFKKNVVANHSFEATGTRLMSYLNGI